VTSLTIRAAQPADLLELPQMQVAAGALFRELGMDLVADGPTPAFADFDEAQRTGRLLVATVNDIDSVVGFVRTRPLDGALHVEQVTVAPGWGGRGIGRSLMQAAEMLAVREGFTRMSLTTFRDIPFNGPFYAGLGWEALEDRHLTPGLASERHQEAAAGLDRWPRLAMVKVLA
jgi:GNAT superfamily N-acetyltransferase